MLKPIRKLIQSLLRHRGYQVIYVGKGNTAPPAPLDAFFMALTKLDFNPVHILDIGANRGQWTRTALRYFPNCQFTLVEPQERFRERIADLTEAGVNLRWISAGVGDKRTRMTLNVPKCDTSASFKPLMGASASELIMCLDVDVFTIDEIVESESVSIPGLVKIDAEGFDLRVLDGASSLIGKTDIFMIEAALFDEQFENTLIRTIQKMDALGYAPLDITDLNRSADSGILWLCEIAFIKKQSPLFGKFPPYVASFQPD